MSVRNAVRLVLATCACVVLGATFASAEIVFLTSGRTLSVKAHHEDGTSIVLDLRTGGEVTCDKSLIEKIVADEVPHPDPAAAAPVVAPQVPAADPSVLKTTPYGDLIVSTAQTYGVDPLLVRALIQVESNYQPRARSTKGAMGLMQLMPAVAKEYKVRNAYDPASNLDAGIQKLKVLIDKFGGELGLALAAYNAGEAAVSKFGGIPPYRETQSYVSRILAIAGR